MTTVDEFLDDNPAASAKIQLQDDIYADDANLHRPDLAIWCGTEDDQPLVILSVHAMWGTPNRYIELTPDKARELANKLNSLARIVEDAMAGQAAL